LADRCAGLIDSGAAKTVVPVLRKAVDRMTTALMYMDDSPGIVGDDLQQVMDLHAGLCRGATRSEKAGRLAGWPVKLECDDPGLATDPAARLRPGTRRIRAGGG
jgi:hypothetical protein